MINNLLKGVYISIHYPYNTSKDEIFKIILEAIRCHSNDLFIVKDISIQINKEIKRISACEIKVYYVNYNFVSHAYLDKIIQNNEKLIKKEINTFMKNQKEDL
jgi:hypothetical protein